MGGISNTSNMQHMGSYMPSINHHSQYKHNDVNNTNDLNPMIMMSGEDGSASYNNSHINMTQTTHNYLPIGPLQRGPLPAVSPSYKNNITNDAINSSIGANPFAT